MALMKIILITLLLLLQNQSNRPEKILKEIYPSSSIKIKNITLYEEDLKNVRKLSGENFKERLVTFYIINFNDNTRYYAYFDVHIVRTLPQVVLFVINEMGEFDLVKIISFREPQEYKADENWLNIFKGKSLDKDLIRLKKDIPNMTGATITAKAISNNARKVLALWKVVFKDRDEIFPK